MNRAVSDAKSSVARRTPQQDAALDAVVGLQKRLETSCRPAAEAKLQRLAVLLTSQTRLDDNTDHSMQEFQQEAATPKNERFPGRYRQGSTQYQTSA